MKKQEFLNELRRQLRGLPQDEIENRVSFYEEMINDMIDEGKTEDQAIIEIGTVDSVVSEIAKDTPFKTVIKERYRPKRSLTALEIVLLVLGFPLWFPLLVTFFTLCLVGYILEWVLVIVTYAVEAALIAAGVAGIATFFVYLANSNPAIWMLGAALLSLGAAFLFIFVCIGATKLSIRLSKAIATGIKKSFIKNGGRA
ncbi:MAG: DUF1700 domain-containing protein [Gammaproteobacteria bacterium]|nr:DUF1700 domain-containing protein [Gammaproteobacteria bacterium]